MGAAECTRMRDVTGRPGGIVGGVYVAGISVREFENIRACGCDECERARGHEKNTADIPDADEGWRR